MKKRMKVSGACGVGRVSIEIRLAVNTGQLDFDEAERVLEYFGDKAMESISRAPGLDIPLVKQQVAHYGTTQGKEKLK